LATMGALVKHREKIGADGVVRLPSVPATSYYYTVYDSNSTEVAFGILKIPRDISLPSGEFEVDIKVARKSNTANTATSLDTATASRVSTTTTSGDTISVADIVGVILIVAVILGLIVAWFSGNSSETHSGSGTIVYR